MDTFSTNVKILRERKGLSQEELAEAVGVSRPTVNKWEHGGGTDVETMRLVAGALEVSLNILLGIPPEKRVKQRRVPVLGMISCGEPVMAVEEYEEYLELPEEILPTGQVIALRMRGDSMTNARLRDGDLALIHVQEVVENGEIAAVFVGDAHEEATIKRWNRVNGFVMLTPDTDNPSCHPSAYREDQVNVLGKVMGVWWG